MLDLTTSTTPLYQSITPSVSPVITTHEPPAPIPVVEPAPAPCEGAYCPAPEVQPTSAPSPIVECKGYDCPAPSPEPIIWKPGCGGVDCPEHSYGGDYIPEVQYDCQGYDCLEGEEENEDHEEDSEGYDFGFEDDEMLHSEMTNVEIDMETGDVNVDVPEGMGMDGHEDLDMNSEF